MVAEVVGVGPAKSVHRSSEDLVVHEATTAGGACDAWAGALANTLKGSDGGAAGAEEGRGGELEGKAEWEGAALTSSSKPPSRSTVLLAGLWAGLGSAPSPTAGLLLLGAGGGAASVPGADPSSLRA